MVYYRRREMFLRTTLVIYAFIILPFLFVVGMFFKFLYPWALWCMIGFFAFESILMTSVFIRLYFLLK